MDEEQIPTTEWDYKSNLDDNATDLRKCEIEQRASITGTALFGSLLSLTLCALMLIYMFGNLHEKCIDHRGTWKGTWCEFPETIVKRLSSNCYMDTATGEVTCGIGR